MQENIQRRSIARILAIAVPVLVLLAVILYTVARSPYGQTVFYAMQLAGPGAFLSGLAFLPAARIAKKEQRVDEAYLWMRRAMIAFLVSAVVFWLTYGAYIE